MPNCYREPRVSRVDTLCLTDIGATLYPSLTHASRNQPDSANSDPLRVSGPHIPQGLSDRRQRSEPLRVSLPSFPQGTEGSPHLVCSTSISFEQGTPNSGAVAFSSAGAAATRTSTASPCSHGSRYNPRQRTHARSNHRSDFLNRSYCHRDRFGREPSPDPAV